MDKGAESLSLLRFAMVLSGMSPLFILWMIKGENIESLTGEGFYFLCLALILIPKSILLLRLGIVYRRNDVLRLCVQKADNQKDHLIVYLFAMLLPFYSADMESFRDLFAHLAAIFFVAFLFWHLGLHYMNFFWAILGYRIYSISEPDDKNPYSGKMPLVLITKRSFLRKNQEIKVFRLSKTVLWEM